MNFKELQNAMMRSAKFDLGVNEAMTVACHGLIGEAGEVIDTCKKIIFHSHNYDSNRHKLLEECSDALWYVVYLSKVIGYSLDNYTLDPHYQIASRFVAKLKSEVKGEFFKHLSRASLKLIDSPTIISHHIDLVVYSGYEPNFPYIHWKLIEILAGLEWVCELMFSSIEELAEINIEKLLKRYPTGFTVEQSINRAA
jgi:NTP pyrophosphatase (non-canonical NTP hydrolase)